MKKGLFKISENYYHIEDIATYSVDTNDDVVDQVTLKNGEVYTLRGSYAKILFYELCL